MAEKMLSATKVENAKPGVKTYKLFDGGGLFLEVTSAGGKYWRYKYRLDGKEQKLALGTYPDTSLPDAREQHQVARSAVAKGEKPVSVKMAKRVERQLTEAEKVRAVIATFRQIAEEWLLMREKIGRAGKTTDRAERMVRYLIKGFGDKPITDVRLQDLVDVLARAESEGKYETRVRLQGAARAIMGYAVARAHIPASPFAEVNHDHGWISPSEAHEKRKAVTDPAKFGEMMRAIDAYEGRHENLAGAALKLLALTFVRPGDVIKAKWEQFSLDSAKWSVPFTQSKQRTQRKKAGFRVGKPHEVPLSRQAVAMLQELKEITGDQPFLFPGRQKARHMSDGTLAAALKVLGYGGRHDPHGFRSSASTILNEDRLPEGVVRFDPALIEMQLDHVDASVRSLYARGTYWADRVNLMQYWADKVDDLRNPPKSKPDLRVVA